MTKDNSSKELLSLYFLFNHCSAAKVIAKVPLDNKRCYECCS